MCVYIGIYRPNALFVYAVIRIGIHCIISRHGLLLDVLCLYYFISIHVMSTIL